MQRVQGSGEFERILDRWSRTHVHLVSQRMVSTLGLAAAMAGMVLLLLVATVVLQQRQRRKLAREVEHRRVLEQDLRRSRNSLEEADRKKDLFLAALAHELRNPLAPILHATRVIELAAGASPDVVQARGVIERQTRHLSRLVDDLDAAAAGRSIIVVDDNVDAAETLAMMLSVGGHHVAVAHTGLHAVELTSTLQPNIVFLDIGLPDIDGLEVCRRLRRDSSGAALTIVAVTGWGGHEDVQRSEQAGFDGHLTKPVNPEDIQKWLLRERLPMAPSGRPC